jgi:hypothetical protein
MGSLAVDLAVLAGLLGLLGFLLHCTIKLNRNRKERGRARRLTERLLNSK